MSNVAFLVKSLQQLSYIHPSQAFKYDEMAMGVVANGTILAHFLKELAVRKTTRDYSVGVHFCTPLERMLQVSCARLCPVVAVGITACEGHEQIKRCL